MAAAAEDDLRSVVQFFELKRKQYCKEVRESVLDIALERLVADVYSRDDVEDILDAAADNAANSTDKTLAQQVNMSALLMEQVYVAALQNGVPLSLDLSKVEDEALLREVGKLNSDRLSALQAAATGRQQLASLGAAKGQLEQRIQDLEAELADAKQRLAAGAGGGDGGSGDSSHAALQTELDEARALLAATSADVAAANERVTSTKQFQQMRALMHKKNEQIEELRQRLAQYEPEGPADGAVHK